MMREMDIRRIKAVLLYILNEMPEGCRDVYHIVKTAFYAQKDHLVKYALPLFNDKIVALPFGPVPSLIYDVLKVARGDQDSYRYYDEGLLSRLADPIESQYESFSSKEHPDMECLSASNVECLNAAIDVVSKMDFNSLMEKTHDNAWKSAYDNEGSHVMDNLLIAKENGASEEVLAYLSDALEFDK